MLVTRINYFESATGKQEELFGFLNSLLPHISSSPGCVSCEVLRNDEHDNKFAIIEKWESKADHKRSLETYPKEDLQTAMKLFSVSPLENNYH